MKDFDFLPVMTNEQLDAKIQELKDGIKAAGWDDWMFFKIQLPVASVEEAMEKLLMRPDVIPPKNTFMIPEGAVSSGIPLSFGCILDLGEWSKLIPEKVMVQVMLTPLGKAPANTVLEP